MALVDFFKLNEPWTEIASEEDVVQHFLISNDLRNVLYRPDRLAPRDPYRLRAKTFENVSFSKTRLESLVFRRCHFIDCLFIGTEFVACEFHACRFEGCNPHKATFERCYVDPECFARMLNAREHANIGVHLFNQLEQNARDQEQHEFVASAAYLYRKWKRYLLNWRRRQGELGVMQWALRWLPDKLYDALVGYGWRISRFLAWSGVLFVAVSMLNYMLWPMLQMHLAAPKDGPTWLLAVYYTVVTLTTLGYGDITPGSRLGMALASGEAFLGLLWLSILASVIFRRVFR
ncbi:MAG TPA: ion channel [Thermoanaerobaculia bacterium]|nr:ion channel [Thermoanaerobaculia bacterium]